MQPDRHAARGRAPSSRRRRPSPARKSTSPDAHVEQPVGRQVENRQEDPEEEERATEIVRGDQHEHRAAPDREQRPEVLEPSLRQHLLLGVQVGGEKDDHRDLAQLAGLELERSDAHPEPGAVDRAGRSSAAPAGRAAERRQAEQVLVRLQPAEVVAKRDQGAGEGGDADHHPEPLAQRVGRDRAGRSRSARSRSRAPPSASR